MSALLTRCSWCGESQVDNLDDVCTSCKQEGYLMDYRVQLCGDHLVPVTECNCLR